MLESPCAKDRKLSLPLVRIYCCYRRWVQGAASSVQCTYAVYIRMPTWAASPPSICRRCLRNRECFSLVLPTHQYTLLALVSIVCAQTTLLGIVQCGFGIIAFSDTATLLSRDLMSVRLSRHAACCLLIASSCTDSSLIWVVAEWKQALGHGPKAIPSCSMCSCSFDMGEAQRAAHRVGPSI